jgi:hypothetical protein
MVCRGPIQPSCNFGGRDSITFWAVVPFIQLSVVGWPFGAASLDFFEAQIRGIEAALEAAVPTLYQLRLVKRS